MGYGTTGQHITSPLPSDDFVKCIKYGVCRYRCCSTCNTKELITREEADRIQEARKALPRTP